MTLEEAHQAADMLVAIAHQIVKMAEEKEALIALVSPSPLVPVADVPERAVTGIETDVDVA
jgi:hypothetical protein